MLPLGSPGDDVAVRLPSSVQRQLLRQGRKAHHTVVARHNGPCTKTLLFPAASCRFLSTWASRGAALPCLNTVPRCASSVAVVRTWSSSGCRAGYASGGSGRAGHHGIPSISSRRRMLQLLMPTTRSYWCSAETLDQSGSIS